MSDLAKKLIEGMEEFTTDLQADRVYSELFITSTNPLTEIWIGCKEGAFVQKEVGTLKTRLIPGFYSVQFGLEDKKKWFQLRSNKPLHFNQTDVPVVPFEVQDELQ